MQINGVGTSHSTDTHHVTECIHDHSTSQKQVKVGAASADSASAEAADTSLKQENSSVSLSEWFRNTVQRAKNIWGKIWGTSDGGVNASTEKEQANVSTEKEQAIVDNAGLHGVHAAIASTTVTPQQVMNQNPYFATVEDTGRQQETIWEKVKVRFQSAAGFLTGRFSFSNKNNFHTRQEQAKEDLSRRSRYRKDDLEIECVITDESYLLDSYNKKGEYSTLSTKK